MTDRIARLTRDRQVIELRRQGKTYDEIVESMAEAGFEMSRSNAGRIVTSHLKVISAELEDSRETFRAECMERLQALLDASWQWALGGSTRHIETARHLITDMADLMGVKAPIKHEFGESDVDRLLREALEELDRRSPDPGRQAADVQADPGDAGTAE